MPQQQGVARGRKLGAAGARGTAKGAEALLAANGDAAPDTIHFDIGGGGVQKIKPNTPFPTIFTTAEPRKAALPWSIS